MGLCSRHLLFVNSMWSFTYRDLYANAATMGIDSAGYVSRVWSFSNDRMVCIKCKSMTIKELTEENFRAAVERNTKKAEEGHVKVADNDLLNKKWIRISLADAYKNKPKKTTDDYIDLGKYE